jgi:GH15 family glucan-1,4-alpha-glucosidase
MERSEADPQIGDHALIGDGRTAALCASDGTIDWLCLPRFDSDPIFGSLVGGPRAGRFSIEVDARRTGRRYRDRSAVLETTWETDGSKVLLTEGMVLHASGRLLPQSLLVRRLQAHGAPVTVRMRFDPANGLGGGRPPTARRNGGLVVTRGTLALDVRTAPQIAIEPGTDMSFTLAPDRPVTFSVSVSDRQPLVLVPPDRAFELLEETDRWWKRWADRISYSGSRRGAVVRSSITLRLLTYAPSGAPVAAPTTSLPEDPGGIRNWDYRYAWPRDAAIGVTAFLATGLLDEAHSFLHWLTVASRLTRPRLQVVYTLDGKPGLDEVEIDDAPGFRGSRPVRLGNAAATQHQLDVYGWVMDAAWQVNRSGGTVHPATWRTIAGFADFVAANWREPDAGIWEERFHPSHHVHSKAMAWVALDRAIRIARARRVGSRRAARWKAERDALRREIDARGFDRERNTFVRAYGSHELDASLLTLAAFDFDEDPVRFTGTLQAIRRELGAGGPLLYRYPPGRDGLPGEEGAFLPCSFWAVQALARTGRHEEAARSFEELCARSNDVGLYAEEMDPTTGQHLGNFPQALTHGALIQAALALEPVTEG